MNWWVVQVHADGGLAAVVSWAFWVVLSIVLHELAHGWAALWQDDPTPRLLGHMTWNPMVHMGPMSLLMFAAVGIAWGAMPTDPGRYRWKRRGRIVVSGAGPAMNILLALLAATGLALWSRYSHGIEPLHSNLLMFFTLGAVLNVALAMLNMLPIPPLDGSSIISGLSLRWYIWSRDPQFQMVGFFLVLAVFVSGLGSVFFLLARAAVDGYVRVLSGLLPS